MFKSVKTGIVVLVYILLTGPIFSATYYVKTNGSNTNTGTAWTQAWQTIQHAADIMTTGDIAYVSNGLYSEEVNVTNKDSLSFIGFGNSVQLSGVLETNFGFKVNNSRNIKIENFDIFFNNKAMIFLSNSHHCLVTNNQVHENNLAFDFGCGIKLIDSHANKIAGNVVSLIEAPINTGNCYGIYLYHSHTNTVISNEVKESGSGALVGGVDIWCHGIYMLNSRANLIRYNYIHDMDHYGIHVQADNTRGVPYTYLNNMIIDNTIYGIDQAILTHTTWPQSINDSLTGLVIGRNKIENCAIGILWDSFSTASAGLGGWLYKNSIATKQSNYNYLEGMLLINSPKINLNYNTVRGFYYGISYYNNGYAITNIIMGSNYNLNIHQKGGAGAQSFSYSCTQANKVGSGVTAGPGNVGGDPLFADLYDLRLQYSSPCIGLAKPAADGVAGCMGRYTSYLRARDESAGNTTAYTLVFVTSPCDGSIPSDGKIEVEFPSTFSFSSPGIESHNMSGSLAVSSALSTITFTRSGGSAFPAGRPFRIVFTNVNNPGYNYEKYSCAITVKSNNDVVIEREDSNFFRTINAPHILTVTTNRTVSYTNMAIQHVFIMSLQMDDTHGHDLKSVKLGDNGNMSPGTDLVNIKLWYDTNDNDEWDIFDTYITNLIWNGTYWSNGDLDQVNINLEYPGQNILFTADFGNTAADNDYIEPYIPADGIYCASNLAVPTTDLSNKGRIVYRRLFVLMQSLPRFRGSDMAVGDLNNDGWLDFIIQGNLSTGGANKSTYRYLNDGDGTFTAAEINGSGTDLGAMCLGDVDNDGDLDMFFTGGHNSGYYPIYLWYNNGSGGFGGTTWIGNNMTHCDLELGDINGDRYLDLIAVGSGRLEIYYNRGNGTFYGARSFGVGVSSAGCSIGDMDNDGDLDLVVAGSGRLDYYANVNGRFTTPQPFGHGQSWATVALGDLNNDGWLDVVCTGSVAANDIYSYVNNRNGTFTERRFGRDYLLSSCALGDVDHDGDLDLCVVANGLADLYYNLGDGNFSQSFRIRNGSGEDLGWNPRCTTGFGDFNNDGDLDLVVNISWDPALIYTNVNSIINQAPPTPVNLTWQNIDYTYRLKWNPDPVGDDHTHENTLRYKVAIGTNGSGIYRYQSAILAYPRGQGNLGNVAVVTANYFQTDIPIYKTLWWKIKSIDTSFICSDYSMERVIVPVGRGPFFVATNGSDLNNGTFTNPFRTIQRAVDVMSMGPTNILVPFCYVFPGVYNEEVIIRSNDNELWMLITALSNNDPPVITGKDSNRYGIFITNTSRLRINGFVIHSNQNCGIKIMGSDVTNVRFTRILIKDNQTNVALDGITRNIEFINNTICKSRSGDGVLFKDGAGGVMFNNIILSNQLYGVKHNSTRSVTLNYNDIFGNNSGSTSGGFVWGSRNWLYDPMLETVSGYTIASVYSWALDSGTNIFPISDVYQGNGPDMGWKESSLVRIHNGPFYVDVTNGLDQYPGSFEAPFQTIQRAAERISGGTNVTFSTCYVYDGRYKENVYFNYNLNTNYMVFRAYYTNRPPVMDGTNLSGHGIQINNASKVKIENFRIRNFAGNGLYIIGNSQSNIIIRNVSCSNLNHGIYINSETADYNTVMS
ncbi:MAG: VCBS repeat-containing protein, partial [Spirochaetes bacterium]|nr:VCBS repeat-containing protein [Spirochaetota bacterium]